MLTWELGRSEAAISALVLHTANSAVVIHVHMHMKFPHLLVSRSFS